MLKTIRNCLKKYFTIKITTAVTTPIYSNSLLHGKVALVIGGCGGIGSAIVSAFLKSGCKVIATGTDTKKLKLLCDKFSNDDLRTLVFDSTAIESVDNLVSDAAGIFKTIDILVYSAGIHGEDTFGNVKEDTWNKVFDVNLKGMYFACQSVSNYMVNQKIHGHILTVSSASCQKPGWTPYEISKAGVRSLTLGFADKLIRHGITVNSIAPGPVATTMLNRGNENLTWEGNPSGRMCTAEEVANIAVIMVSDIGNMIVGDTFFLSGGSGTICIDK